MSSSLQFTSYGLAQLIVGRIVSKYPALLLHCLAEQHADQRLRTIAGAGNGMAVAVLVMWNGECSRYTNRGRAILWQLNINIVSLYLMRTASSLCYATSMLIRRVLAYSSVLRLHTGSTTLSMSPRQPLITIGLGDFLYPSRSSSRPRPSCSRCTYLVCPISLT